MFLELLVFRPGLGVGRALGVGLAPEVDLGLVFGFDPGRDGPRVEAIGDCVMASSARRSFVIS